MWEVFQYSDIALGSYCVLVGKSQKSCSSPALVISQDIFLSYSSAGELSLSPFLNCSRFSAEPKGSSVCCHFPRSFKLFFIPYRYWGNGSGLSCAFAIATTISNPNLPKVIFFSDLFLLRSLCDLWKDVCKLYENSLGSIDLQSPKFFSFLFFFCSPYLLFTSSLTISAQCFLLGS